MACRLGCLPPAVALFAAEALGLAVAPRGVASACHFDRNNWHTNIGLADSHGDM